MKSILLVTLLFVAMPAAVTSPVTIVLVGDSTVKTYEAESPLRGWGQVLPEYFADDVKFINLAEGGRSSVSFLSEGRLEKALAHKPEFLLIQFGLNDRAKGDPRRYSNPATTYRENLRRFISEARAAGAKPILITPPSPRSFSPTKGTLHSNLLPYADAMKVVAEEEGVPVIDLHTRSLEHLRKLGARASEQYAPKKGDINHFNERGARKMAEFIIEQLPREVPELAMRLKPVAN